MTLCQACDLGRHDLCDRNCGIHGGCNCPCKHDLYHATQFQKLHESYRRIAALESELEESEYRTEVFGRAGNQAIEKIESLRSELAASEAARVEAEGLLRVVLLFLESGEVRTQILTYFAHTEEGKG